MSKKVSDKDGPSDEAIARAKQRAEDPDTRYIPLAEAERRIRAGGTRIKKD